MVVEKDLCYYYEFQKMDHGIFNVFHQIRPRPRTLSQRLHDVMIKTVEEKGGNPTASDESSPIIVAGTAAEVPG